jgi:hypothetical protein
VNPRWRRARIIIAVAAGGLVVAALSATGASAATVGRSSASTPSPTAASKVPLSHADQADLIKAYAAFMHIPTSDITGIRPGSLHGAVVRASGVEWGTAGFSTSRKAPLAVQFRFQDGGSIGVFTHDGHSAWKMRAIGGEPFPCASAAPAAVTAAWGTPIPAACHSAGAATAKTGAPAAMSGSKSAKPGIAPAANSLPASTSGTTTGIADEALAQVGVSDTPASTNFSQDCDPYTTLVNVGASTAGCGTDPTFHVQNENEEWCADFAKWVWEQGGVTSDLSTLNPGATSFATWAQQHGQSTAFDTGTPKVGDAIVFYPPGTSTAVGSIADHVGLIVGVDSSNGTVDMVNGDFLGSGNISVQESGYVNIQSFANAVWSSGEKWVLVSSGLPTPSPSSPSPLSEDMAGQMVAFVNSSGQLVNDYYSSGWKGPGTLPGTPRADSPIVVTPNGEGVFFIESNGDVANDYHTSSGWAGPGTTGGVAAAGSSLAYTPGNSSAGTGPAIAFVNTSGTLVNDYYTGSWNGPGPLPGTPR